jgi:biopolymer transport protein ExbD
VLTSLIDVIFLLVIFFMVTSQITPFSLIPLGATASGGGAPAPADAVAPVALRIQAGRVSIGGKPVELAALPSELAALRDSGVSALVLSSSASATVQDLVSVLEMCRKAAFETVTVLNRPGAGS